ncbi:MAG: efflux transporter periplasmic adaptor subunit [Azospira oryzae]|nr:MAG: efflux transporter periplasmic adaptor subunit [Azospira oryzae]PZP77797.1 MAG: efflux transporter periplasmic adaptor subunit [Azospira oryzae]
MKPSTKKGLIALLALAVVAGVGLWWRNAHLSTVAAKPAPSGVVQAPPVMTVRAARVKRAALREEVSAVGTLLANESVMIRPEVDGRISEIHFTEGQFVARGARLVSLDSSEIEAQLRAVEAEVTLNRSRLKRAEELKEKNFISAQALDEARENLNQSLARQAEIQARLEKTVIRAPFDGVVGLSQVSPGAYVNKGQDIARLEGIGTLKLDFRVPEVFLSRLRVGQEVTVAVDAYPNEQFKGQIYAIEPAVDEQTRTVLLRARIPNPGVRLKPGMFARVSLTLGVRDNALVVPEEAIVPRGQELFVFKVVDGKALLTQVELGLRRPGEAEILAGLAPGDVVVTDGHQRLRDGAQVEIVSAAGAPPQTPRKPGNG